MLSTPWLSGQGVSSDQILNAAASASLASADEWTDLLGSPIVGSNDTVPTDTSPSAVPVGTEPPFAGEPRDVAIPVTVDDVSNNEQRWSGVLPTGESWSAKIIALIAIPDGTLLAELPSDCDVRVQRAVRRGGLRSDRRRKPWVASRRIVSRVECWRLVVRYVPVDDPEEIDDVEGFFDEVGSAEFEKLLCCGAA